MKLSLASTALMCCKFVLGIRRYDVEVEDAGEHLQHESAALDDVPEKWRTEIDRLQFVGQGSAGSVRIANLKCDPAVLLAVKTMGTMHGAALAKHELEIMKEFTGPHFLRLWDYEDQSAPDVVTTDPDEEIEYLEHVQGSWRWQRGYIAQVHWDDTALPLTAARTPSWPVGYGVSTSAHGAVVADNLDPMLVRKLKGRTSADTFGDVVTFVDAGAERHIYAAVLDGLRDSSGVMSHAEVEAFAMCQDTSGWQNAKGFTCNGNKSYESEGWCRFGELSAHWTSGEYYNHPERHCCSCGKQGQMIQGATCRDTPNWRSPRGFTCAGVNSYQSRGWCAANGSVVSSKLGAEFGYPENNCCICGRMEYATPWSVDGVEQMRHARERGTLLPFAPAVRAQSRLSTLLEATPSTYGVNDLYSMVQNGTYSRAAMLTVIADAAEGLAEMHSRGFIHRDVKPDNILITKDSRGKIMDFTCSVDSNLQVGFKRNLRPDGGPTLCGTPTYMPPELYDSPSHGMQPWSTKGDVVSLGLTLYFAFFKTEHPAAAKSWFPKDKGPVHPISIDDDENVKTLDESWRRLFNEVLAYDPERRIDMAAFARQLREGILAEGGPTPDSLDSTPPSCSLLWQGKPWARNR